VHSWNLLNAVKPADGRMALRTPGSATSSKRTHEISRYFLVAAGGCGTDGCGSFSDREQTRETGWPSSTARTATNKKNLDIKPDGKIKMESDIQHFSR
jgi:hypothetical protein